MKKSPPGILYSFEGYEGEYRWVRMPRGEGFDLGEGVHVRPPDGQSLLETPKLLVRLREAIEAYRKEQR